MAWFFSHQVDIRTDCCIDPAERSTIDITGKACVSRAPESRLFGTDMAPLRSFQYSLIRHTQGLLALPRVFLVKVLQI